MAHWIQSLVLAALLGGLGSSAFNSTQAGEIAPDWIKSSTARLEVDLVKQYGEGEHARLVRGMNQVARLWRKEDGDAKVFESFVREHFAGDAAVKEALFARMESLLESLDGHLGEINHAFRKQSDLDLGPVLPFDEAFGAYDPFAHVNDDFFQNKLAFDVLLNFPLTTLEQRLSEGERWTRRQWAEARLAQRFSKRIPAEISQGIAQVTADAELYITEYKIWMHHLITAEGQRPFPAGMRLISHWNLRDEIKAQYGATDGLSRQRLIQLVMERIIDQSIPQAVINNPFVDWNPVRNEVATAAVKDTDSAPPKNFSISSATEPDTRYAKLLAVFHAVKKADPYSPSTPTWIARKFEDERQIPEARVKALLEELLNSPNYAQVGRIIEGRLNRPLEPFDVWYDGFRPRQAYSEQQLDKIVAKKYPTADAYRQDIPRILMKLNFTRERAEFLRDHILVEASRGTGHAMGATMRGQPAHLRTRVGKEGMNYKGYNIALHEMGHNIEQTFSVNMVDHTLLQGVPNNAFTEAMAFVFQERDIEALGLARPDAKSEREKTLGVYWSTCEIAGVALVDMGIWRWMYDHPDATSGELKAAVLQIAKDVWNQYYAPVFKKRDVTLLAVYSHIINNLLYVPDYPIGHLIAFQIEAQIQKTGKIGPEVERMTRYGNVSPDLWMKNANGSPVSADALLSATKKALSEIAR